MYDPESLYSLNARNMRKSVIRELLKLTQKPDIISFAGGLPDPATFPVEELRLAAERTFEKHAAAALQYGTTEGDPELKRAIIGFEAGQGIRALPENILIVSGSQQGLDMLPKLFLDPGDCVIAGRPTYVGAIQAIQSYRATVIGIPFSPEDDGFDMSALDMRYEKALREGKRVKYIYVIPDFQNPSGICWSLEKRLEILEFARERHLPLVEDSPYREIRFHGASLPSLYKLDAESPESGNVISLRTFSKILAPGARTGWIMARPEIIARLVIAKQAMDLCTSVFTQRWLAEFMASGKLDSVIAKTCSIYGEKRDFMLKMLDRYMPSRPDLRWTKPEGGLFLWISLPSFIDTDVLLRKAIERKVAYVSGSAFYFDDPESNSMRINFSYPSLAQIEEGIRRLSEVVIEAMEEVDSGLR